jgi:hypothetical protein
MHAFTAPMVRRYLETLIDKLSDAPPEGERVM